MKLKARDVSIQEKKICPSATVPTRFVGINPAWTAPAQIPDPRDERPTTETLRGL
jgi:hypothetical protein